MAIPIPRLESHGAALTVHWESEGLSFVFDRFAERNDGVQAELVVTRNGEAGKARLFQSRVNLLAPRTRSEVANRLKTLLPGEVWDHHVEQACLMVLAEYRKGEPVVDLSQEPMLSQEQVYSLKPLVFEGLATVVFADGGSGKSYLGLLAALLVESQTSLCGLEGKGGKTLFLDWEADRDVMIRRWRQIRNGHPQVKDTRLLYRRMDRPLWDDVPTLQRHITEQGISFVVLDSLAPASGADVISPETTIRFFSALRSLKVSALILAHVAKHTEKKSIYGSVFNANLARAVWEVRKTQEEGETELQVGLYHRKCNLSRLHMPMGLSMKFQEESDMTTAVVFHSFDLSQEPELAKDLPLKSRLKQALSNGAKMAKELATLVDAPLNQVQARLSQGKNDWCCQVGKTNDGHIQWGLTR